MKNLNCGCAIEGSLVTLCDVHLSSNTFPTLSPAKPYQSEGVSSIEMEAVHLHEPMSNKQCPIGKRSSNPKYYFDCYERPKKKDQPENVSSEESCGLCYSCHTGKSCHDKPQPEEWEKETWEISDLLHQFNYENLKEPFDGFLLARHSRKLSYAGKIINLFKPRLQKEYERGHAVGRELGERFMEECEDHQSAAFRQSRTDTLNEVEASIRECLVKGEVEICYGDERGIL